MTMSQMQAAWELCRNGFPLTADEATARWEKGETFEPDRELRLTRKLERLVDHCNWEIDTHRRAA